MIAWIQEAPLVNGKRIAEVALQANGSPSSNDYRRAKTSGHLIVKREPMCGGLRYYAGKGAWK